MIFFLPNWVSTSINVGQEHLPPVPGSVSDRVYERCLWRALSDEAASEQGALGEHLDWDSTWEPWVPNAAVHLPQWACTWPQVCHGAVQILLQGALTRTLSLGVLNGFC